MTLSNPLDAKAVAERWEYSRIERLIYTLLASVGCKPNKTYNGNLIDVERAPEPLDIFWENLGFTWSELFEKRSVSIGASILLLGASFGAILGVKAIQESVKESQGNSAGVQILSVFASYLIVFINGLLGMFIRRFSGYEKHDTYTSFYIAVAWKLSLVRILKLN